ncbi:MAG: class I adenylate-forming enzyme family protein [Methylophilaceae bacterium]
MSHSLCKAIDQSFNSFSKNTALIQHQSNGESVALSYEALKALAGKVYSLFDEDLTADQCIGLYMQRSVEHVASIVASIYSKSPYTTINNLVSAKQVCHIAQDSNLKILICDNSTILKLRALTQDEADKKTLSSVRIIHIRNNEGLQPVYKQTIELLSDFTTIESIFLAEVKPYDLQVPRAETINKSKLILFTSGSTGNPKGVMIKGDDLIDRVESESKAYGLQEGDVLLNILPFSFDVGCNQLYSSLIKGCRLVLLNSWMPKDMVSAIVTYQVTGVSGVPSLWLSIVNANLEELKEIDGILRYITISGGDMAEKDRLALRDLLPNVKIFKTYGQTETFRSGMLLAEHFDAKHKSVGKPVEGVELLILDDNGNKVAQGQIGEIIHQGIGTMLGYIGDKEATNRKLKNLPQGLGENNQKVIYTGDLGSIDEDGFLYLHGRQDRMFKVRGNRVYPEEIERELCAHEEVIESASSYDAAEELITVYVRKKEDSALTEKAIIKFLSTRLPSYMMPSHCLLYDDFPRTASGKIDVPTLTSQGK